MEGEWWRMEEETVESRTRRFSPGSTSRRAGGVCSTRAQALPYSARISYTVSYEARVMDGSATSATGAPI